ncbi:hypothetical protein, partial [Streptomyces sp. IBSBF 2435]|uniref:hypothetical protein n=1 Tax=Streptomyces sp. IBSBF 2435 TaxID=2903531 RepID=UPI002FDBB973
PAAFRPVPPQPAVTPAGPFRRSWEIAMRYSALHRNARLVGLTIATFADYQTGLIAPLDHPSVVRLSKATALELTNVRTSLHRLKGGGWIERTDVDDDTYPSRITLLIPEHARLRE